MFGCLTGVCHNVYMTRKKTTSKKVARRTKSAVAGKGKKKSTRKTARKRVVKKATAKQAPLSRVQEAPRRGDHLPYTYDTPVGELRKSLGVLPCRDDDMKYGDYLRKIGQHAVADILKQITEKYA